MAIEGIFLLIALVDILLKTKLYSCWCITASQFCQFMWRITCTKMKTKDKKTDKEMEIKDIHSISTFSMSSFNQRRNTEQQSPMMKPTILNLLRKKKYEIIILDVCLKQKLRWMIFYYGKTTNNLIGRVGSVHRNASVLILLWISLTKELQLWKNASGVTLKNKYNIVQPKYYIQGADNKSKSTSNEESAKFWNHAPD